MTNFRQKFSFWISFFLLITAAVASEPFLKFSIASSDEHIRDECLTINYPDNRDNKVNVTTAWNVKEDRFHSETGRRSTWLSVECKNQSQNDGQEEETEEQDKIKLCIRVRGDAEEEEGLEARDWTWKWVKLPSAKYCLQKSLEQFSHKDYSVSEGEVGLICRDFFDEPKELWASATTIRIILGILVTITSIFFIVILVVHVVQWKKQGLPGWLTIALVTTMFVLHIIKGPEHVWGVTTHPKISSPSFFCVVAGISIHFLHLASFAWFVKKSKHLETL